MLKPVKIACLLLVALGAVRPAAGQMFGNRPLGNTLRKQPSPGGGDFSGGLGAFLGLANYNSNSGVTANSAGGIGTLTGSERFIRGNRQQGNFVGVDMRDQRDFVGLQQGTTRGAIRSAISELREPPEPPVNQPRGDATARARPYDPRLAVGFEFTAQPAEARADLLARQLSQSHAIRWLQPLSVSVAGQTAILRGEVASERDRTLAGLVASLEPGIAAVQNELTVRGTQLPPPAAPPSISPPPRLP